MQFNITKTIEENKNLVDTDYIYNKTFKRFEQKVGENWSVIEPNQLKKIISEPTGFALLNNETDIYSSIISFSVDGTRILSITPSNEHFIFYINGKEYVKTDVSQVQIADIEGLHYIYFNENGILESKLDFAISEIMRKYASVATVYWDYTNKKAIYIGDKRHAINTDAYQNYLDFINDQTVEYIEGTAIKFTNNTDGSINNKVDGSGTSNYHTSFAVEGGKYRNYEFVNDSEHIEFNENIPIFYKQTITQEKNWIAMANNSTTIVAISNDGEYRLMYSEDDGDTWTKVYLPYYSTWTDIIYAQNKFVAVASSGDYLITISSDGKIWTPIVVPQKNKWQSIAYGNNTFVVVGLDGLNKVMTSTNASLWITRETPSSLPLKSVAYINESKFIAVSEDDILNSVDVSQNIIAVSKGFVSTNNGLTWDYINISHPKTWRSIHYANGRYIALSTSGKNRLLNTNSTSVWPTYEMIDTIGDMQTWESLAYSAGYHMAIASDGTNRFARSTNGSTWTSFQTKTSGGTLINNPWHRIVVSSDTNTIVILSRSGTNEIGYTSTGTSGDNGSVWTFTTSQDTKSLEDIVYGADKWVAIASANTAGNRISYSTNLTSWTDISVFSTTKLTNEVEWRSIAYGNGYYTAVGVEDVSWKAQTVSQQNQWQGIAFGNGIFVAVAGNGSNRVMTSTDGRTWTVRNAAEANNWTSITFGNGTFVAVAASGTNRVMTSTDGVTWVARTAAAANEWRSVTFGNNTFVAVSSTGTGVQRVMTSSNGTTWTIANAAQANTWQSVTFGNNTFVAVASDGTNRVMTSSNGTSWTVQVASSQSYWYSVTYGANLFMAVVSDPLNVTGANEIMTSYDGITWVSKPLPETKVWFNVSYGNGYFVIVGYSNILLKSTDGGNTWTSTAAPSSSAWCSTVYSGTTFASVAFTGTHSVMIDFIETARIAYSANGITWTESTIGVVRNWIRIKYLQSYFFALNTDNEIYYSANGVNGWLKINFSTEINSLNLSFVNFTTSGLQYIFLTSSNKIVVTGTDLTDTAKMNVYNVIDNLSFTDITSNQEGQVVIANKQNNVMTSDDDGVTWNIKNITNSNINKIKYFNDYFILLGTSDTNRIIYSNKTDLFSAYTSITNTSFPYSIADMIYKNNKYVFLVTNTDKRVIIIPEIINTSSENILQTTLQKEAIRDINNAWRRIDNTTTDFVKNRCIIQNNKINYNKFLNGLFSLEICNNKFYLYHIFMSNDKDNKYIIISGNYEYDSVEEAKNSIMDEINKLNGLPFNDFLSLGSIVFEVNDSYTNTAKARIVNINGNNYYKLIKKDLVSISNNLALANTLRESTTNNNNLINNTDLINLYGNKILEYALNKLQNLVNRDIDNFITRREIVLNNNESSSITNIFGTQITGSYEVFDKNNPEIGMILFLKQSTDINTDPTVNITSYSSKILPNSAGDNASLGVYIDGNRLVNFKNIGTETLNLVIYRKI